MQVSQKSNFPKRMRYYQGMIDLNLIERGADYNDLRKSYIIFICPFDVFEKGLHKYTFENQCIEMPELKLDDETRKIFLCAGGTADDVSDDMKDFLDWLIGKQGKSELVKALDNAVQKARNHEEWRLEYMTLLMRDQEMIRRGREEGLQVGREEGLQAGRLQEIFLSVQEGDYSIERGAQKSNMSEKEFEELMVKEGYKLPTEA